MSILFADTQHEIHFAGCRGACDQGRKECAEQGKCFIVPAGASTDIGAEAQAVGIVGAILLAAHLLSKWWSL